DLSPGLRAEWDAWAVRSERATTAIRNAHAAGQGPPPFNSDIWAELKAWLFTNVFNGRCAYCEGDVKATSFGDAEHWRPKGAVTEDGAPVRAESGEEHPGYFWLAYEWRNLLPACQECNSGEAEYKGKGTQFPICGTRVFGPENYVSHEELNE